MSAGTGKTAPDPAASGFGPRRRARARASLFAQGEPIVWLMGGGLVVALVMIAGLLGLVATEGLATFAPRPVVRIATHAGKTLMGEVEREQELPGGGGRRRLVRIGNFELTGEHYAWVADGDVVSEDRPPRALALERMEWGRFYGEPAGFLLAGKPAATTADEAWQIFGKHHE